MEAESADGYGSIRNYGRPCYGQSGVEEGHHKSNPYDREKVTLNKDDDDDYCVSSQVVALLASNLNVVKAIDFNMDAQ